MCSNAPAPSPNVVEKWDLDGSPIGLSSPAPPTFLAASLVPTSFGSYEDLCWKPQDTCEDESDTLVLWYDFEKRSNKAPGGGHPIQLLGLPLKVESVTEGISKRALTINSDPPYSAYAITETGLPFPSDDFSICVWIYPWSTFPISGVMSVFEYHVQNSDFRDFAIALEVNKLKIYINGVQTIIDSSVITLSEWSHICVTRRKDIGRLKVYINGANVFSEDSHTSHISTGGAITVGLHQTCARHCFESNTHFSGSISDLMVFKRVLRPIEIYILGEGKLFACGQKEDDHQSVCNNREPIEFPNMCKCGSNWTGNRCQYPVCDGKGGNDPDVCSRRGTCTDPLIGCVCQPEWGGPSCQHAVCFDKHDGESGVCSGRGECKTPGVCVCETGWTGTNCQFSVCNGISSSNSTSVCSGNGICDSTQKCNCYNGWEGDDCEIPKCYGFQNGEEDVCSGKGLCIDKDVCECDNGWTGSMCRTAICFNVSDESTVCSGNGVCEAPDTCLCETGLYRGQECERAICFGFDNSNGTVCSGHGSCNTPGKCDCEFGWKGTECEKAICHGLTNEQSACGENGKCISPNFCECDPHWFGSRCDIPECNGVRKDSPFPIACSGNGECISANMCRCDMGWTGIDCQIPMCYSIPANETEAVCSGHGKCLSPNRCQCTDGWGGLECDTPICNGFLSDSGDACSKHGECNTSGKCDCYEQWTGINCQYPMCNGIGSDNTTVCSGRGTCSDSHSCICISGWTGDDCQFAVCFGKDANNKDVCYGNGKCNSPGKCSCDEGWLPPECMVPVCHSIPADAVTPRPCSGNGACVSPDNCDCGRDWIGDRCDIPVCFELPQNSTDPLPCNGNGECVSANRCACSVGWTGDTCDIPICFTKKSTDDGVCSDKGTCELPDTCICDTGYRGLECEKLICFGLDHDNKTVCSGNGVCTGYDTCTCHYGWADGMCQMPLCHSIRADDPLVCSGNGTCTAPDSCICESGFTEEGHCAHPICHEIAANETNVCNGHGACISPDQCVCRTGYIGEECQDSICFDHTSTDIENVCSGRGTCTSPDHCDCNEGYVGEKCEVPICFGILGNDTERVCHGNGTCREYNDCLCEYGFTLPDCAYPICYSIPANDTSIVCNGHGTCIEPNNCQCDPGYSNIDCRDHHCFDILFNNASVCSSHGTCDYPEKCECFSNWTGQQCEIPKCNGVAATNHSVCSGFGVCHANHTCTCDILHYGYDCQETLPCYPGYFGRNCELQMSWFEFSSDSSSMSSSLTLDVLNHNGLRVINCSEMFTAYTMAKIGEMSRCTLDFEKQLFIVTFGSDATLMPHDEVDMTILRAVYEWINETSEIVHLKTNPSKQPENHVHAVIEAPDEISTCSGISLDAISSSKSPDSRPLRFNWTFVRSNYSMTDDLTSYIESQRNQPVIIVDKGLLVPGFRYTFSLQVMNFLGQKSNIVEHTVEKKSVPIAAVFINLSNLSVTRNLPVSLEAVTELDDCFYDDRTLRFLWEQTAGPSIPGFITSSIPINQRFLSIPPGSFPNANDTSYKFRVTVRAAANSGAASSASAMITVRNRVPELIISGGDRFIHRRDSVTLIASCNEPEESNIDPNYNWECVEDGTFVGELGSSPCSFSLAQNNPLVAIGGNILSAGSFYSFIAKCTIGDQTVKKTTKIFVSPSDNKERVLRVNIRQQNPEQARKRFSPNVKHGFLGVIDSIQDGPTPLVIPPDEMIHYEWTVIRGNIAFDSQTLLSESNTRQSLVLREDVLTPGSTYTLCFMASGPTIGTGYAYIDIDVNDLPNPGLLSVSPSKGTAMTTLYTITASQWTDTDLPLFYKFFYIDKLGTKIYLGGSSLSNSHSTYLPQGTQANDTLEIGVEVSDVLGATSTMMTTVRVIHPKLTHDDQTLIDFIQDQASSVLQSNMDSGNVETVAQLIHLYTTILNEHTESDDTNSQIKRKQLRQSMLSEFVTLETKSPSIVSMEVSGAVINSITAIKEEISPDSVQIASGYLKAIITRSPSLSLSSIHDITKALSNLVSATASETKVYLQHFGTYSNEAEDKANELRETFDSIEQSISVLARQIAMSTLIDEPEVVIRTDNIHWSVSSVLGNSLVNRSLATMDDKNAILTHTAFPETFKKFNSSLITGGITDTMEIVISQTVIDANPYQFLDVNHSTIVSPVLTLKLSRREDGSEHDIEVIDLAEPFILTLPFPKDQYAKLNSNTSESGYRPSCRYWDETTKSWKSDGCTVISVTQNQIRCSCDHLTAFSSSVDYIEVSIPPKVPNLPVEVIEKNFIVAYVTGGITVIYLVLLAASIVFDIVVQGVFPGHVRASLTVVDPYDSTLMTDNRHRRFRYLFKKFKEYFLWGSMIIFTHRNFARAQRLTVVYLAILTMITVNVVSVSTRGKIAVTWWHMMVNGLVSNVIAVPLVSIVSMLFIKTEPFFRLLNSRKQQQLMLENKAIIIEREDENLDTYETRFNDHNSSQERDDVYPYDMSPSLMSTHSSMMLSAELEHNASPQQHEHWSHIKAKMDQLHNLSKLSTTNSTSSVISQKRRLSTPLTGNRMFNVSNTVTGTIKLAEISPIKRSLITVTLDMGDAMLQTLFSRWESRAEKSPVLQWLGIIFAVFIAIIVLAIWITFIVVLLPLVFDMNQFEKYISTVLVTAGAIFLVMYLQQLYLKLKIRRFRSGKSVVWSRMVHLQALLTGLIIVVLILSGAALLGMVLADEMMDLLHWMGLKFDIFQLSTVATGTIIMAINLVVWIVFLYVPPPLPPLHRSEDNDNDGNHELFTSDIHKSTIHGVGHPDIRYKNEPVQSMVFDDPFEATTIDVDTAGNIEACGSEKTEIASSTDSHETKLGKNKSNASVQQRGSILQRKLYDYMLLLLEQRYWFRWHLQIPIYVLAWILSAGMIVTSVLLSLELDMEHQLPFVMYTSAVGMLLDISVTGIVRFLVSFILFDVIIVRCFEALIVGQLGGPSTSGGSVVPETFTRNASPFNTLSMTSSDGGENFPSRSTSRSGWMEYDVDDLAKMRPSQRNRSLSADTASTAYSASLHKRSLIGMHASRARMAQHKHGSFGFHHRVPFGLADNDYIDGNDDDEDMVNVLAE